MFKITPNPDVSSPLHIYTMSPYSTNKIAIPRYENMGNKIWIFTANFPPWQHKIQFLKPMLTKTEFKRSQKFYFEKDRSLYILAHGLLRLVLGRLTGLEPPRVPIKIAPGGKPYMPPFLGLSSLNFNLSHSKEFIPISTPRKF